MGEVRPPHEPKPIQIQCLQLTVDILVSTLVIYRPQGRPAPGGHRKNHTLRSELRARLADLNFISFRARLAEVELEWS